MSRTQKDAQSSVCAAALLILFAFLTLGAPVATAQQAQPAATLYLARQRPRCCKQPTVANLSFTSDHTISASYCEGGCRLYAIEWDGGTLKVSSETATDANPTESSGSETIPSNDGSRLLEVRRERKIRGFVEMARTVLTFGMSGEEWDNHETFTVIDTVTGKTCFEWSRTFEKSDDVVSGKNAVLSPSGEFLAVATKNGVSLFRIPNPVAQPAQLRPLQNRPHNPVSPDKP